MNLESTATSNELQAVHGIFHDFGLAADVAASIERKAGGDLPWVIYVCVAPASAFFGALAVSAGKAMGNEFGQAAGKALVAGGTEAWQQLKGLIKSLYRARGNSGAGRGAVILRVEDIHQDVFLPDDLPDPAWQALFEIRIKKTESRQLRWDGRAQEWHDSWDVEG